MRRRMSLLKFRIAICSSELLNALVYAWMSASLMHNLTPQSLQNSPSYFPRSIPRTAATGPQAPGPGIITISHNLAIFWPKWLLSNLFLATLFPGLTLWFISHHLLPSWQQ